LTLPVGRGWRATATAPLILVALLLTVGGATGALAGIYTLAVTAWWANRATRLALGRPPAADTIPPPRPAAVPAGTVPAAAPARNPPTIEATEPPERGERR
jgi:hypothetical protein